MLFLLVYLPWMALASLPIGLLIAFADQLQPLVGTGGGMAMGAFAVLWLAGTAVVCLKGLNHDFAHTQNPLARYLTWVLNFWVFKFWTFAGLLLAVVLVWLIGDMPRWATGALLMVGIMAGLTVGGVSALLASVALNGK